MPISPGIFELVNGLCALIAALLIWRITANFWVWLGLWGVGATFVTVGVWKVLKDIYGR